MKRFKELEGAWEEPGVIGTRIEIEKNRITVLWRNAPVLETAFSAQEENGALTLALKETGMRYAAGQAPYARVTLLRLEGGKLLFKEDFPITGESARTLEKTDRSRYGNYRIADDEILPLLKGTWVSDDRFYTLEFSGAKVTRNGAETRRIHILESLSSPGRYRIADADPARYELFEFADTCWSGGEITAHVPVCDAPSMPVRFTKL